MAGGAEEIVAGANGGEEGAGGRRGSGSLAPSQHYPDYSSVPQLPALDSSPRHSLAPNDESAEEGAASGAGARKESATSANAVVTQVAPATAEGQQQQQQEGRDKEEEEVVLDPANLHVESETTS